MTCDPSVALINKKILYTGTQTPKLLAGTRVRFHYVTKTADGRTIDDSRRINEPLELVLGKSFKMECWEVMIKMMAVNEVAQFDVDKSLVVQYPFVMKTIRDARKPQEERKHCCGMTVQTEGLGYPDLNDLMSNPCNLQFTFELLSAENEYERDAWQMDDTQKLVAVERARTQGNEAYKARQFDQAEHYYCRAIGMTEQLLMKERPQDEEWQRLIDVKMPILLNYAQCKLLAGDFYAVIEHCNEVLKHQPDNVKALFRRAKAHRGAWNPTEARTDYERCIELNAALEASVRKELAELSEAEREHDQADKLKFQNMF